MEVKDLCGQSETRAFDRRIGPAGLIATGVGGLALVSLDPEGEGGGGWLSHLIS
jgi:hypothetical protein